MSDRQNFAELRAALAVLAECIGETKDEFRLAMQSEQGAHVRRLVCAIAGNPPSGVLLDNQFIWIMSAGDMTVVPMNRIVRADDIEAGE